jgi:hypothetical protein
MRPATPAPSTTVNDHDMPPLFLVNDRRALAHQDESFRVVRAQLVVLLLATGTAALAEHVGSRVPSAVAAVLYGLTIAIGLHAGRRRARAHWQVHRAAAEAVKSLAWQYMAHGGPFHSRVANPDELFAERLDERLRELRKVGWEDAWDGAAAVGTGQITGMMRRVRAKSFLARRDVYLRDRVQEQLVWYRNRAGRAHRAAVRWSRVTAVLTLMALLAAFLRALGAIGGWDLTGFLSTSAAAAVAWQEVRRHRPLTYAHSLVEQDLETLRVAMGTTVTERGWAAAVAEAERLVSPQHTDWLGRFGT